jgi:hypothetical protein
MTPAALASEATRALRDLDAARRNLVVEPNQPPRSTPSKALCDLCLDSGGFCLEPFELSHCLRSASRLDPSTQQGKAGSP